MRYSTSKYVQVLYSALEGKSGKDVDLVVSNFVKLLARNRHLKYSEKIITEFNKLYNKENGIAEVEVISREFLDKDSLVKIKELYKKSHKINEVKVENTLDKKMKGGVVIVTDDEIMDGSIDKKLMDMRKKLLTTS